MDAVEAAQNGHPGLPMGAAPMAYVLWDRFLRHDPSDPAWPDRDRFILSAGHGSMLLYGLLHLTGYDLPLEELRRFRQWGSRTPGHPEVGHTPGVEATTGPLGQGFANGVGMAIAQALLAARYNRPGLALFDHYIYALVSDGDLMEGVASEAASLAGHLGLGRLVYLYDDNRVSLDGPTDLAFTEDRLGRFAAYGWHVQQVEDGNDLEAIAAAIAAARAEERRPSLIAVRTHLGYGAPHKQDTAAAHGAPLGAEEVRGAKRNLGWPEDATFWVPEEVRRHMGRAVERGRAWHAAWHERLQAFAAAEPEAAAELRRILEGRLPDGLAQRLPRFASGDRPLATRVASGRVLAALAPALPELAGGSADLASSTHTRLPEEPSFTAGRPGRNLDFGVREHAMGAILNGMALAGLRPYGGTFLVFSDYMRGAIRVAALSRLPVVYVFTHDSIGLGQDGPTHQPVEQLAALRAMPGLTVIRPADAGETAGAWQAALERGRPTVLALSRQETPILSSRPEAVAQGGYVLAEAPSGRAEVLLIGTGTEVALCLAAQALLAAEGIEARVVSLPSWELFEEQPEAYRRSVLPPEVRARVAVEAGVPMGWERYLGEAGVMVGVTTFGASAPGPEVMRRYGFTPERVAEAARESLRRAGAAAAGERGRAVMGPGDPREGRG